MDYYSYLSASQMEALRAAWLAFCVTNQRQGSALPTFAEFLARPDVVPNVPEPPSGWGEF